MLGLSVCRLWADGQAAFFVVQPSMAGILSKDSPEMGAGDAGD